MPAARPDTGSLRADAAIVGGGLAGMVAAARACELGRSVVVLEAGPEGPYPCNVRYSGGVLHVAFCDIKSPPDVLLRAIAERTAGQADPAQAEAVARNAGRLVDWMRMQGVAFTHAAVGWQSHILAPSRAIAAGQDWRDRGPDVMLRTMADRIRERGGRILTGTRARSLIMREGRCAGVVASAPGGPLTIEAGAVILADGGFQANRELVGRHIAARPERLKQRGGGTGMGDGLRMAEEAGAEITRLDCFYGHLLCRDAMHNDNVWPYPELDALALAGLLVDASGERFFDEGLGGVALANALARHADPLSGWAVFDHAIWEGPGRSARIPANPTLETAGGTILRAASIAEIAGLAGISPVGLSQTVAAHNGALRSNDWSGLAPPRTIERHRPMPIATPPYMAIPVCAGITYTMGGIRVDGSSRVLRPDGRGIPGLYAAGSTTGGLEGGETAGYIGGLAKAGVQGLLAAEHIAAMQQGPAS